MMMAVYLTGLGSSDPLLYALCRPRFYRTPSVDATDDLFFPTFSGKINLKKRYDDRVRTHRT